jgi:mitogen-activated protein kinase 1/3
VAIKHIKKVFDNFYAFKKVLREIQIMKKLSQMKGNIFTTRLFEIIVPSEEFDDIFLVMNYHQKSLRGLMTGSDNQNLSFKEEHVKVILYNLLCSMKYLHSANVIHRDIKPGNILINSECNVLLCDFGLSRTLEGEPSEHNGGAILKKSKRSMTPHVVSRWYRPPELILGEKKYSTKIDDWSIGCVMGELVGFMNENRGERKEFCLFKGNSCYPFSPRKDDNEN